MWLSLNRRDPMYSVLLVKALSILASVRGLPRSLVLMFLLSFSLPSPLAL